MIAITLGRSEEAGCEEVFNDKELVVQSKRRGLDAPVVVVEPADNWAMARRLDR